MWVVFAMVAGGGLMLVGVFVGFGLAANAIKQNRQEF